MCRVVLDATIYAIWFHSNIILGEVNISYYNAQLLKVNVACSFMECILDLCLIMYIMMGLKMRSEHYEAAVAAGPTLQVDELTTAGTSATNKRKRRQRNMKTDLSLVNGIDSESLRPEVRHGPLLKSDTDKAGSASIEK